MTKQVKRAFFIAGLLLICHQTAYSQGNLSFNAGMGFAEAMNVGLRFQPGKIGLGMNVGTWPSPESNVLSVGGDVYYHFAGQSAHTSLPVWYARGGMTYTRDNNPSRIYENTYLDFRAGRVINFSPRLGLEVDAGLGVNINYHFENKQSNTFIFDLRFPVIPTFGVRGFVRL